MYPIIIRTKNYKSFFFGVCYCLDYSMIFVNMLLSDLLYGSINHLIVWFTLHIERKHIKSKRLYCWLAVAFKVDNKLHVKYNERFKKIKQSGGEQTISWFY